MTVYWNTHREIISAPPSMPSIPSVERLYAPICTNDWLGTHSETTKDVLQSVLKVRKSWKTLRNGQTVWPLDLEAALLEGLQNYVPDDSRETRMLGRFPRRNRFISDYIFQRTGKRRSAKQVGSRLQQLRESCVEKKLLHLLSPFQKPAARSPSSDRDSTSPVPSNGVVYILDILPEDSCDDLSLLGRPQYMDEHNTVHISDHPRRLSSINPMITFLSPSPLTAQSRFAVHSEDLVLHTEIVPLVPVVNSTEQVQGFLYSTSLVPEYWKVISKCPDLRRFTISHDVVRDHTSEVVFSATYKFAYPEVAPTSPSTASSLEGRHPHASDVLQGNQCSRMAIALSSLGHHSQSHRNTLRTATAAAWNPAGSSRGGSPMQGNLSPSSDTSTCFPSDLSNYVL